MNSLVKLEFSENKIHNFELNEKVNGVLYVDFIEEENGEGKMIIKLNEKAFKYSNFHLLKPSQKPIYVMYQPSSSPFSFLSKVKVINRSIVDKPPHAIIIIELLILNGVKDII